MRRETPPLRQGGTGRSAVSLVKRCGGPFRSYSSPRMLWTPRRRWRRRPPDRLSISALAVLLPALPAMCPSPRPGHEALKNTRTGSSTTRATLGGVQGIEHALSKNGLAPPMMRPEAPASVRSANISTINVIDNYDVGGLSCHRAPGGVGPARPPSRRITPPMRLRGRAAFPRASSA